MKKRVQPLRVLRALAPALADHRAHDQRHATPGRRTCSGSWRRCSRAGSSPAAGSPCGCATWIGRRPARAMPMADAGHGVLGERRAEDALGGRTSRPGRASCPGSPWGRRRPRPKTITRGSRAISWSVGLADGVDVGERSIAGSWSASRRDAASCAIILVRRRCSSSSAAGNGLVLGERERVGDLAPRPRARSAPRGRPGSISADALHRVARDPGLGLLARRGSRG